MFKGDRLVIEIIVPCICFSSLLLIFFKPFIKFLKFFNMVFYYWYPSLI
jgi:hypothetical protein